MLQLQLFGGERNILPVKPFKLALLSPEALLAQLSESEMSSFLLHVSADFSILGPVALPSAWRVHCGLAGFQDYWHMAVLGKGSCPGQQGFQWEQGPQDT